MQDLFLQPTASQPTYLSSYLQTTIADQVFLITNHLPLPITDHLPLLLPITDH